MTHRSGEESMDYPEMDDKLYYVESNQGQVLGPLNMMLILEGVAAGRISEAARICEVGQNSWVSLTDIAQISDDGGLGMEVSDPEITIEAPDRTNSEPDLSIDIEPVHSPELDDSGPSFSGDGLAREAGAQGSQEIVFNPPEDSESSAPAFDVDPGSVFDLDPHTPEETTPQEPEAAELSLGWDPTPETTVPENTWESAPESDAPSWQAPDDTEAPAAWDAPAVDSNESPEASSDAWSASEEPASWEAPSEPEDGPWASPTSEEPASAWGSPESAEATSSWDGSETEESVGTWGSPENAEPTNPWGTSESAEPTNDWNSSPTPQPAEDWASTDSGSDAGWTSPENEDAESWGAPQNVEAASNWETPSDSDSNETWETPQADESTDSWGSPQTDEVVESWGTPQTEEVADSWGSPQTEEVAESWGTPQTEEVADTWGSPQTEEVAETWGSPEAAAPEPIGQPLESPDDDFRLTMSDESDSDYHEEPEAGAKSKRWMVPAIVAVAIPVVTGVYLLTGGHLTIPGLEPDRAPEFAEEAPRRSLQEAWALLSSGQLDVALAQFREFVEADPTSAEAHHGLGRTALRMQKLKLAKRHFGEAVRLAPESSLYLADLAQAQLDGGDVDVAVSTAKQVLQIDSEEPRAHLVLGRAWMIRKDYPSAVREFSQFLELAPRNRKARLDLAVAHSETGRLDPAIEEISAYLEAYPQDIEAQTRRLEWMSSLGRKTKAAKTYAGLADRYPEDGNLAYLAGLANEGLPEGVNFLKRAVEMQPKHRDAFLALAEAERKGGHQEAARNALQRAFAIKPASPDEEKLLARVDQMTIRNVPAPKPKQPEETPLDLALRVQEIQAALDRGAFDSASNLVTSARSKFSKVRGARATLDFLSAVTQFEEGNFAKAVTAFGKLDPDHDHRPPHWKGDDVRTWDVRTWTAWCHLSLGDIRASARAMTGLRPNNPDDYALARLWEGLALSELGMNDLAVSTWREIQSVGNRLGDSGKAALLSAEFLSGQISAKAYRTNVNPLPGFENDIHFFLGHVASAGNERSPQAREHFLKSVETSRGKEFPFHLARLRIIQDR